MAHKPASYYVAYEPRPHHPGQPWRVMRICPASGQHSGVGRFASERAAKGYATKRTNAEAHFNM